MPGLFNALCGQAPCPVVIHVLRHTVIPSGAFKYGHSLHAAATVPPVWLPGSYWATKHFSYFVEPGSVRLAAAGDLGGCKAVNGACGCAAGCTGSQDYQAIPFLTPAGDVVLVVSNAGGAARSVKIVVDGGVAVTAELPADSMNTFTIPSATAAAP